MKARDVERPSKPSLNNAAHNRQLGRHLTEPDTCRGWPVAAVASSMLDHRPIDVNDLAGSALGFGVAAIESADVHELFWGI